MLFIILIVLCVVLVVVKIKTKNASYWKKKNILEIEDLMWTFMFDNRSMPEICKTIYDKYDVPHIGTYMGTLPTLILKDIEDLQAVLAGDFQSFSSRGLKTNPNDVLGDNLVFMHDFQRWKLVRQKLSPVFTSLKLKNMFYILDKCARDFVTLVNDDKQMRLNPYKAIYTYTTAAIAASVFGIDTQTKSTMDSPFLEMAWKSLEPSTKNNIIIMTSSLFPKLFSFLRLKRFGEHEYFFVSAVKSVFSSRKNDPEKKRYDFIEICLELQKSGVMKDHTTGFELNPTDELLAAQAFFFFIAGADTTANAMHFTLLEIANNRNVLARVHNEIDSMFKNAKEELTYNDVESLPYLDMVISEGIRKYPPVGFTQRICTKDTVLPSGLRIEKDTAIVVPIFAFHRDEKYYPNPELFDPERFRPDNVSNMNKFTYLPFGEGNRICIGAKQARLQMKAGLTWLLRHYTLAEQKPPVVKLERSAFGLKDSRALYDLISRNTEVL